ncbi:MAG: T9SS type A sorting domain-containing protein [Bacteroidota bacterium]
MKLLNSLSIILLGLILCLGNTTAFSQCVPDSTITGEGIFPDTLVGTCVGIPYSETITLVIPTDTIVGGLFATIDSLVLDSVAGLPPGLRFDCLNGQCSIAGGSRSCVLLSGTPSTAGVYPVDLYVTGYVKVFGNTVVQPDTLSSFYTLIINPGLTVATSSMDATCGGSDGTATATPSGTAPYTYLWSNGAITATATGLAAGLYSVTVTDVNGCEITETVEVQNVGSIPAIAVTSAAWVGCSESGGGAIDLTTTGGSGNYTYSWSNGATSEDLSGLAAGTYTVTVSDDNSCTDVEQITIMQPALMEVGIASQTNLLCPGTNSGAIVGSLNGGEQPYAISWDTNPATPGLSINNLPGGTYTLSVTDNLGCMKTAMATLTEPPAFVLSIADTSETAAGAMNGSATATATGGTPPYTYSWSNQSDSSRIDSLAAGTYFLNVTDANGCQYLDSVVVGQWAVGLEDELAAGISSMSIYPNPNQGYFSVELNMDRVQAVQIQIYDLQGQEVFVKNNAASLRLEEAIDLSEQGAGMYIMKITSPRGVASRKFMIE